MLALYHLEIKNKHDPYVGLEFSSFLGGGVTSFKLKVFVSYSSINLLVKHIQLNFTGVSCVWSRCAAPLCVCLRRVVWSLHAPFAGPCGTDPQ